MFVNLNAPINPQSMTFSLVPKSRHSRSRFTRLHRLSHTHDLTMHSVVCLSCVLPCFRVPRTQTDSTEHRTTRTRDEGRKGQRAKSEEHRKAVQQQKRTLFAGTQLCPQLITINPLNDDVFPHRGTCTLRRSPFALHITNRTDFFNPNEPYSK